MKVKEATRMHEAVTERFDVVRREGFEINDDDGDYDDDILLYMHDQLHIYSLTTLTYFFLFFNFKNKS